MTEDNPWLIDDSEHERMRERYEALRVEKGGKGSGVRGHRTYRQQKTGDSHHQFPEDKEGRQKEVDVAREKRTMDAFLAKLSDGMPEPQTFDGNFDDSASKVRKAVTGHLEGFADVVDGKTYSLISKVVSDQGDLLKGLDINAQDAYELGVDSVNKLMYQEMRSWERQLGDHGIRHIEGNIRMANEILESFSKNCKGEGCGMANSQKNQLVVAVTMINHDLGYTAKHSRESIKGTKYHKEYSETLFESQKGFFEKILGKDRERTQKYILEHDTPNLDWEKEPVLTAVSVADNLALFQKEKLPSLFTKIPGALDMLFAMQKNLQDGDVKGFKENQRAIEKAVDNAKLPTYTQYLLKKAAKEISPYTPPVTLSMLAGEIGSLNYSAEKGLDVEIKWDRNAAELSKLYDQGQSKFVKLADAFGVKDFESDHFEFVKGGKNILSVHSDSLKKIAADWLMVKGGPGSGNFGHKGRPGERGGSGRGGGVIPEHSQDIPEDFTASIIEEIGMPEEYLRYVDDDIHFRQCFFRAFMYMLHSGVSSSWDGGNMVLVHGICELSLNHRGLKFGHGWVEIPKYNAVFDGVVQRFFDKDDYYNKMNAVKVIEYDEVEAMILAMKSKNAGPWTELGGI